MEVQSIKSQVTFPCAELIAVKNRCWYRLLCASKMALRGIRVSHQFFEGHMYSFKKDAVASLGSETEGE